MGIAKRLLFICHDGDLYGAQKSLCLIIRHLPKADYECFVSIARPGPLENVLAKEENIPVFRHQRLQWVKHDPRSWLQKIGDCFTLLANIFPRTFELWWFIREHKMDLVCTNSTVSLEGALAASCANLPHIWHIRELFMEKSPKFHMVLGRRLSRWMIHRFSDAVICISNAVRDQFGPYLEEDPEKYWRIYNALDLSAANDRFYWSRIGIRQSATLDLSTVNDVLHWLNTSQRSVIRNLSLRVLKLPSDPDDVNHAIFRLGYIGRLSEGKGFHDLLEALIELLERDFNVELLVVGNFVDEAYKTRILSRIEEADVGHAVHLLGYQDDLQPIYEVVDVLVVPSQNEPFGRVVIEAMANGTPCIGANAGGIPELIEDGVTGFLYPPGDVSRLIETIENLMPAFWKLETIRQNARRMVYERFNIETQVRTLDECYQSVLEHHQLLSLL